MMIKVKSNKKVNIRAFEPYQRSNNLKGELNAGFEIEVEEVEGQYIEEGEGLDKIASSKWYKDKNGDYYWSGGFEQNNLLDSEKNVKSKTTHVNTNTNFSNILKECFDYQSMILKKNINLNEAIQISSTYKESKGKDTTIAILDHPFQNTNEIFQNRYSALINGGDIQGYHGLQMASIIGADDKNANPRFTSLCPESKILSAPIIINGSGSIDFYKNAITKLLKLKSQKPMVINVSLTIKDVAIQSELASYFIELAENYIVVAAAGQDEELLQNKELQWPAKLNNVIAVGSIKENFIKAHPNTSFNNSLDILMPEFDYPAFNFRPPPEFKPVKADSAATAVISSVAAMILNVHGAINKQSMVELLHKECLNFSTLNNLEVFKPINPKK
jgi:hypothetical protein